MVAGDKKQQRHEYYCGLFVLLYFSAVCFSAFVSVCVFFVFRDRDRSDFLPVHMYLVGPPKSNSASTPGALH